MASVTRCAFLDGRLDGAELQEQQQQWWWWCSSGGGSDGTSGSSRE
jgi:hypothetical protein